MSVEMYSTRDKDPTKFTLGLSSAVITFESCGIKYVAHLKNVSHNESFFNKLKSSKEIKFVGTDIFWRNFQKVIDKSIKFEKVLEVPEKTQIVFFPESGKVRVEKKETTKPILVAAIEQNSKPSAKKKVLVIDDSPTVQKLLCKIISESSKLEVMDCASCADDATKIIEETKPDLITLDIHMPGMNGVEYLKTYLHKTKIPVVMISSVSIKEGPLVMEALSSGAATYVQKPSIDELSKLKADVLASLEAIANVDKETKNAASGPVLSNFKFNNQDCLIAIGSSTGGTQALQSIFTALPSEIPPIVVTQHIPAVFSKALADRLDTLCKFRVKEAEDGEAVESNCVYIAPGGKQMKLKKQGALIRIVVNDDPPLNRFQPSVDYLFNSIAEIKHKKIVAAILTGMGKDGAKGLLELKNKGAHTIAQDEASSIVFGMPKEAIAIGAHCEVKSLEEIPLALANAADKTKKAA